MNKIVIKGLSKSYDGKKDALNSLDLVIPNGMFGILGRNGSGKSTLMNIIATILQPSKGTVTINGIEIKNSQKIRQMIGYLPQDFDFYPNMKVSEVLYYLGFLSKINQKDFDKYVDLILRKVNLIDYKNKKVKSLSGGMKKRLGIAQAILHDPKVIIVDEPTAGLDPEERVRLRNLLSDLAENKIVIISTHIVSDIESTCNRIAILDKGSLVYKGDIPSLIQQSDDHIYEINLSPSELESFRENDLFITKTQEIENKLKVRFISETKVANAKKVKADFEDAYMYFLKKQQGGLNHASIYNGI
ncbi:ABC transporter ATP-binding protein [Staphylococcus epidermidis]|jgi:ABC superfamily ATP binding cassette transporter ABC protein|uniref:ABC transporter ATP-binding protein n=2 Tax=Staphylococcus epidermidis TaxID=1282 RepID=A0AAE5V833_STAEP|nr:ABC transporter ATP-binding protein [Staphylococcus epidermidis]EID36066.1 ABC transporter, ATP-binding protein [Staphylococcus epidermidis IS-250]CVY24624.1 ABC transporter ATP-binding protein [Streptococcus pneumoniae]AVP80430.1 ABC transporter ATP-binding protein [Staphylococcus epidermidis]AVP80478.1 ABC transporter ATP-binding protein [Staphylococcus epidermidis]AVP80526.1 ABC transporter ATP-binding protein [Staphylococcus epidermidis]